MTRNCLRRAGTGRCLVKPVAQPVPAPRRAGGGCHQFNPLDKRPLGSGWVPRPDRRALLKTLRKAGKTGQATCVLIDGTQVTVTRFWCGDCGRHHALVDFLGDVRVLEPSPGQVVKHG